MKTYTAQQIIEEPFSSLPDLCTHMNNKREIVQHLEGIAERAAMMAAYIDEREGYGGCGDQGHKKALKAMNRAGKLVHLKVFGFMAFHDLSF
jgi:uncharacterized protein YcaQ